MTHVVAYVANHNGNAVAFPADERGYAFGVSFT